MGGFFLIFLYFLVFYNESVACIMFKIEDIGGLNFLQVFGSSKQRNHALTLDFPILKFTGSGVEVKLKPPIYHSLSSRNFSLIQCQGPNWEPRGGFSEIFILSNVWEFKSPYLPFWFQDQWWPKSHLPTPSLPQRIFNETSFFGLTESFQKFNSPSKNKIWEWRWDKVKRSNYATLKNVQRHHQVQVSFLEETVDPAQGIKSQDANAK